jgi:hypothetical protein
LTFILNYFKFKNKELFNFNKVTFFELTRAKGFGEKGESELFYFR